MFYKLTSIFIFSIWGMNLLLKDKTPETLSIDTQLQMQRMCHSIELSKIEIEYYDTLIEKKKRIILELSKQ